MQPTFPLHFYFKDKQGNVEGEEIIDHEDALFTDIEFFTSGDDGYVIDAEGRRVRVTLTPNRVTYAFE